jgi:Ser/Thr protein kinase RdoA (MazF antagonist)
MSKPPTSWRDLNPRRLNQVAREVLRNFGLTDANLFAISQSENRVWKVFAGGERFVLRCHRPSLFESASLPAPDRREIESELQWLRFLKGRVSFEIPDARVSVGGESVLSTQWDESIDLHWSLLRWIPGRQLRKSLRPGHMTVVGGMMGELHSLQTSPDHPELKRPSWDRARMDRAIAELEPLHAEGVLDAKSWSTICRMRDHVALVMKRLSVQENPLRLIHADIHPGNLLFVRNRVSLIDFSSCGFGYRAFDIAQLLMMAPDDTYWEAFWEGYGSEDSRTGVLSADARAFTGYCVLLWLNYNAPSRLQRIRSRIPRVMKRVLSMMGLEDSDNLRTPSPSS